MPVFCCSCHVAVISFVYADFVLCSDGKCQVKFGTGKSEIIQDAEYVDPSTLK